MGVASYSVADRAMSSTPPPAPPPPSGPRRARPPGSAIKAQRLRRTQAGVAVLALVVGCGAVAAWPQTSDRGDNGSDRDGRRSPSTSPVTVTVERSSAPRRTTASSASTSSTASTASTASTVPPGKAGGETVTLAFAGDVNFNATQSPSLLADPGSRIRPMRPWLERADLAVLNLETAITTRGVPTPKEFTFRAPPSVLRAFPENGVDAVSMANNHGMDFGAEGLLDSIAAKRSSPVAIIGIGADEDEAFAPFRAEVRGQRIAVIAATQVLDDSLISEWTATPTKGGLASAKRVDRLVAEVRKARASSDTVVVFLHWGIEETTCPSGDQRALAVRLVAAGADVIVGGHAHRVLGGGRLGRAFVHYGLGNFGFYAGSPAGAMTGVLTVAVRGRQVVSYEWVPGVIRDRVPYPLEGDAAASARAAWDGLRPCAGLAA